MQNRSEDSEGAMTGMDRPDLEHTRQRREIKRRKREVRKIERDIRRSALAISESKREMSGIRRDVARHRQAFSPRLRRFTLRTFALALLRRELGRQGREFRDSL